MTGSVWHWEKDIQGVYEQQKTIENVSKILGQILRTKSSQKTRKNYKFANSFEIQPPRSPELNPADFLSVGTLKVLVYSAGIRNEETLHQRVFMPVRPIATALDLGKCATVHDQMCPCVPQLGWRIFWTFLVNCNLINNKNWTVIGLGMCIVNVMLVVGKILHS